ncbi:hypothetical protein [Sphingomonas sp. Leaf205]|uniref:hypothetical protein n=1 Tax=Sphingomonas sp. Leaf205 TaxID=2876551 RepID=UPI001E61379F|nr:hypothetical protein [Sphingomonas sp. Leaf205]
MKILYECLILGLTASAASADTLPAAKAPEVVKGVQSCLTAVDSHQVNIENLKKDGWSAVSASKAGKPVGLPIPLFFKGNLLLLHKSDAETPICAVMAKVPNVSAVDDIANAIDIALKTDRKIKDGKAIPAYWFPAEHIVELATTGSVDVPGVRIVVGYRK